MAEKRNWESELEALKQSGMSHVAWCKKQGIPSSTLSYHLHKSQDSWQNKFAELKNLSSGIKIRWGRMTFELDPSFDEKTLCRLLKTLEKVC